MLWVYSVRWLLDRYYLAVMDGGHCDNLIRINQMHHSNMNAIVLFHSTHMWLALQL
jgi:hypothetical protein